MNFPQPFKKQINGYFANILYDVYIIWIKSLLVVTFDKFLIELFL